MVEDDPGFVLMVWEKAGGYYLGWYFPAYNATEP